MTTYTKMSKKKNNTVDFSDLAGDYNLEEIKDILTEMNKRIDVAKSKSSVKISKGFNVERNIVYYVEGKEVIMNEIDYYLLILQENDGSYLYLYNLHGVTDETIKASGEYAIKKIKQWITIT